MSETRAPARHGWALFAGALALGLAWRLGGGLPWTYAGDALYDDGVFLQAARAFLTGGEPPATQPPGYPFFLAAFLAWGEWTQPLILAAQLLLAAAFAPAVWSLALRQGLPPRAALIAGAFAAANPVLLLLSARFLSETVFVGWVLGFFFAWDRAWRAGSLRAAALAGLFGGLASLTRGVMLPFGGVLALAALLLRKRQPRWAGLVAVCGLCWAAAMAPWTVRNWVKYQRFMPVSAQGGWNFYEGMALGPEALRERALAMGREAERLGLEGPFEVDAYFARKARAEIREDPGRFAALVARKAAAFWRLRPYPPHGALARWAGALYNAALLGLALYALARAPWPPLAPFILAWALHLNLLHAVFASTLRYRMPAEILLALLAGAGGALLLERASRARD